MCLFIFTPEVTLGAFDLSSTSRKGNTTIIEAPFKGVDVVEWSRALNVRLREWYCSVSMV